MKISQKTKFDVNSYTVGHFTNKGSVGYTYFKLFLELALEKYRQIGYIPNLTISELIKLTGLKVTVTGVQRSIQYFFNLENIHLSIADAIAHYTEEIIDAFKLNEVKEDEF